MVPSSETSAKAVWLTLNSTQTKIKNYFYGNIRLLLKVIIQEALSNKAGFVNDIRTDLLLDIYEAKKRNYLLTKNFKETISYKGPLKNSIIESTKRHAKN